MKSLEQRRVSSNLRKTKYYTGVQLGGETIELLSASRISYYA